MKFRLISLALCTLLIVLIILYREALMDGFTTLIFNIQSWQNQFQRTFSQQLSQLRGGHGDMKVVYSLITLAWLYGVLHAAGPGHGKAIITTWALTQRDRYGQILFLSSGGALLQAISALLWVVVTIGLAQWFIRDSLNHAIWMNRLSYALIISIGIYIVVRAVKKMRHPEQHHCYHHNHDHDHDHDHDHMHHHLNTSPNQMKARLLAILSIGIRPCSGALIILSVAASWQLWSIGILMTFAMAIGTAFTVSLFGLLVTFGRRQIAEAITRSQSSRFNQLFHVISIFLGLILCSVGIGLMLANAPMSSL